MSDLEFKNTQNEFHFTPHDFHEISEIIYNNVGIVLGPEKQTMVYSRLTRRLRALGLKTFKEYCELVKKDKKNTEITQLINALTTNLTRFFREDHHFKHLKEAFFTPFHNSNYASQHKRIRIWSAGCSSGEEPYSIGMTLLDSLPTLSGIDAKILATDVDTNMVSHAANGVYQDPKGIPHEYLNKFCHVQNDEYIRMKDSLKNIIHFKHLNLQGQWPMKGPFDVIFCRNVVIYFDKPTQTKLFNRFADLLAPHGWLYIGHSESLYKVCDRFNLVGRTIYQKVE